MSKRKTKEEFVAELNDDNVEVLGEYISNNTKLLVRYKDCSHEDYKKPSKLLYGQRCSLCKGKTISKSKTKSKETFLQELSNAKIDYIDVLSEYTGVVTKIFVKNKKCGHEYYVKAGNLLYKESGCPICHGMKDTSKFESVIHDKYPGKYQIVGEYVNNRIPIRIKHICGYEWCVIPKDLMRAERCPKCMKSKGELFIEEYLTKLNLEFEPQYRFADCKDVLSLPFDFMVIVNGKQKLIEFDGIQHFQKTRSIYNTNKVFEHDRIKNDFCNKNNIPLLRIPYWYLRSDKIDKVLNEFLFE